MVIVHIANIDTAILGGVQIAVPQMVRAQSQYADVGLVNTHGDIIDNVQMLGFNGKLDINQFPAPFNKPDFVIFHEVYRFEYISIYKELLKHGIPYIVIPHGCLSKDAQQKKKLKKITANFLFFNDFLKNARLIQYLSINEKSKSAFQELESLVIGNGVPVPTEKKTIFDRSDIRFVYIGRLEIYIKGLDLLFAAVKKSESLFRRNNAVMEIYGPDYNNSHEIIRRMICKLKIEDLVCLKKETMGAEKRQILFSSTCFIQASRSEGLPLGPLEALSYGLPCIVTQGVGLGDMIESYGAGYQSSNSAEGLSASIDLFFENIDKLEDMSQSAVRLIEENFNVDLVAQKTVDRYCSMLN